MAGLVPTRSSNADIRDYTWLGSAADVQYAHSATLHYASLNAAGNHKLENWVKSGTPLGEITAAGATQGQLGLYDPAATDGRQNHVGFLMAEIQLQDAVNGTANTPLSGAVLLRGMIQVNRLPVTFNAALTTASKNFIYKK